VKFGSPVKQRKTTNLPLRHGVAPSYVEAQRQPDNSRSPNESASELCPGNPGLAPDRLDAIALSPVGSRVLTLYL